MTKLKYGQTTLEELKAPIDTINAEIQALETEHATIEKELDKDKNSFSLTVLDGNKTKVERLKLIHEAIDNAKKYRKELIDGKAKENHAKAMAVITKVELEAKDSQNNKVELMKNKVDELKAIYAEIKEYDNQVRDNLTEYAEAVSPYLSKEDFPERGSYATYENDVSSKAYYRNSYSDLSFVKIPSDEDYPLEKIATGNVR